MAEMLLINPRKRRSARKATAKRRVVRRRNPVTALAKAPKRRRHNPIGLGRVGRVVRRRRNPIGGVSSSAIMNTLKTAAIGGAGAVAVDFLMGQVQTYLPASLKPVSGKAVSGYDAVKLAVTLAAGELLNKPTKGMSRKLAAGALTVQMSDLIRGFLPGDMALALGYASPAAITRGQSRVGPMMRVAAYQDAGNNNVLAGSHMQRLTRGGSNQMLHAYAGGGRSALLSGARESEGFLFK